MSTRGRGSSVGGVAVVVALALALALGCSRRDRSSTGPLSPHVLTQAPVGVAPAAPRKPPAPTRARSRPELALIYSSDLRGVVSAKVVPRKLPPGVGLTPLAPRESTGGLGRRATLVDRARLEAAAVIQVDAGDFLPLPDDEARDAAAPDAKDFARWADLVLAGARRLGVDAVTLGERELAQPRQDPRRLARRLAAAHVPVVLANLRDRKGALVFAADQVIDAAGVAIGVFGVTELPAEPTAKLAKAGYAIGDAREAARATARALRERGAKLVVALVHAAAGRARAQEIVAGLDDVDVEIVSAGHDAPAAAPAGAAAVATRPRPVTAGDALGRLDIRGAAGGAPEIEARTLALGKEVREQLGVSLLTRVPTIPLIDTKRMEADMARGNKRIKMRDLYEPWYYASTKACGYCHEKIVAQWETTDHAHALATLTKAKHDHDPACLGCHTMGFLEPGGTRDIVMVEGGFANVGCEACHGPSAEHVRSVDKKKGTSRKVDPIVCLGCHTPDQNVGAFDPVAAIKEILGPDHGAPVAKR